MKSNDVKQHIKNYKLMKRCNLNRLNTHSQLNGTIMKIMCLKHISGCQLTIYIV